MLLGVYIYDKYVQLYACVPSLMSSSFTENFTADETLTFSTSDDFIAAVILVSAALCFKMVLGNLAIANGTVGSHANQILPSL